MEYDSFVLIDEELKIIQDCALSMDDSKIRNNSEIKKIIETEGYKYMEDFLEDDLLAELNELNNFNDINPEVYTAIEFEDIQDNISNNHTSSSHKDMVQESVVEDFDDYACFYKIKGSYINPNDWDTMFDTMFSFYVKKDISVFFYYDMERLNRFAFSLALLKKSIVDMNCYKEGLGYLESTYLSEDDILYLKCELDNKINNNNTISFIENKCKTKIKNKSMCNLSGSKVIDFNSYKKSLNV